MRVPEIVGLIDRRILVNYRVDPAHLAPLVPPPFRPLLRDGWAVAGICLIRLSELRPRHLPASLGLCSENAAHRIAVEWDVDGTTQTGVYIPRRDTSSRFNALVGGRLFPGLHHRARFEVQETASEWTVRVASDDGDMACGFQARMADRPPAGSVFRSGEEAAAFFRTGCAGYSASRGRRCYEGLELRCQSWEMQALEVAWAQSSWFDDSRRFPPGSVEFDSAFLMRSVPHRWVSRPALPMSVIAPPLAPGDPVVGGCPTSRILFDAPNQPA